MLRAVALCGAFVFCCAGTAQAEWHFTPMAGFTMFGNTSLLDAEAATGRRHLHTGGSVALFGSGIFGAEVLTVWTPGFFEHGDVELVESSRTVSGMVNVIVTTPRRWTEYGLRPFLSGGFGLMHAHTIGTVTTDIFPINVNTAGLNIGGGAIGFLSDRTGLRFDIRYHSTLNRLSDEDVPAIGPVHLRYVTASVGIVFRR